MNIYFLFFSSQENRLFISSRPRHRNARRLKHVSANTFADAKAALFGSLTKTQKAQVRPFYL